MLLALETVPIGFLDVVRRVGKHQINTRIIQRSQPIYGVALKQHSVWVFVLELETFGNRVIVNSLPLVGRRMSLNSSRESCSMGLVVW